MISSVANPQIARALRLHARTRRAKTGLVIVEGARTLTAALAVGSVTEVFHTVAGARRRSALLEDARASGATAREVSDDVMAALTSTASTPDVLGIAALPFGDAGVLQSGGWPAVLLRGVRDPGAAGTILAAAAGFGVDSVVQGETTVDLADPRVLRAAAGAHFLLRLGRSTSDVDALSKAAESGGAVVRLHPDGPAIWDSDLPDAMMLLVHGAGDAIDEGMRVSVPSRSPLPLATSVSIILHEWAKAR